MACSQSIPTPMSSNRMLGGRRRSPHRRIRAGTLTDDSAEAVFDRITSGEGARPLMCRTGPSPMSITTTRNGRASATSSPRRCSSPLLGSCPSRRHPLVSPRSRRRVVSRFPYGIPYQIRTDRILALAIMHLKRSEDLAATRGMMTTAFSIAPGESASRSAHSSLVAPSKT